MLKDKNIVEYIEAVDSESLPGGGSVASLSGALGISLARMLAHLSVNKKKFKEAKEEERNAFIAYANDLKGYRNALIDGIDADASSYECVVEAYKSKNEESINSALHTAAYIALDIQRNAYYALRILPNLIKLGNKNVLNDLIAGAILLLSCVEISALNVKTNALLLNNEQVKKEILEESEALVIKAKNAKKTLLLKLNNH